MHHPSLSTPATSETWKRWFARRVALADLRPGWGSSCCRFLASEWRLGSVPLPTAASCMGMAWRPGRTDPGRRWIGTQPNDARYRIHITRGPYICTD